MNSISFSIRRRMWSIFLAMEASMVSLGGLTAGLRAAQLPAESCLYHLDCNRHSAIGKAFRARDGCNGNRRVRGDRRHSACRGLYILVGNFLEPLSRHLATAASPNLTFLSLGRAGGE